MDGIKKEKEREKWRREEGIKLAEGEGNTRKRGRLGRKKEDRKLKRKYFEHFSMQVDKKSEILQIAYLGGFCWQSC